MASELVSARPAGAAIRQDQVRREVRERGDGCSCLLWLPHYTLHPYFRVFPSSMEVISTFMRSREIEAMESIPLSKSNGYPPSSYLTRRLPTSGTPCAGRSQYKVAIGRRHVSEAELLSVTQAVDTEYIRCYVLSTL